MVGPILAQARPRARGDVLRARRRVPRPRAEPAARGEPAARSSTGCAPAAPTSASPGTATPTAASSSTAKARFCDGDFVCALLARARSCKQSRGDDPLRPALEPGGPRSRRRRGRALRPLAGRPRLLQEADARGGCRLRRRGLRPLLLPRLLECRLGDDPGAADAGAALGRRSHAGRADGRVPLALLHLR